MRVRHIGLLLSILGSVCLAAGEDVHETSTRTWNGALADVACLAETPGGNCEAVSGETSAFAVVTSNGDVWRLDTYGNDLVRSELKKMGKSGPRMVSVRGKAQNDCISVESVLLG